MIIYTVYISSNLFSSKLIRSLSESESAKNGIFWHKKDLFMLLRNICDARDLWYYIFYIKKGFIFLCNKSTKSLYFNPFRVLTSLFLSKILVFEGFYFIVVEKKFLILNIWTVNFILIHLNFAWLSISGHFV